MFQIIYRTEADVLYVAFKAYLSRYGIRSTKPNASVKPTHGNIDLGVDIPAAIDCLQKAALLGHKDAQAEFKRFCSGLGTTAGAHGVPIDMVKEWLIEAKLGSSNASEDLKALDPLAWEEANQVFFSTLVRPRCICTPVNLSFPASAKWLKCYG